MKSTFKKTEIILRNYKNYRSAVKLNPENTLRTKKLIKILENAMLTVVNDHYYDIITLYYFENQSREKIAEYFNVDVTTIARNKSRLVNKLKYIIFSDEAIKELFNS